jgi:hypothetical protein
MHGCLKAALIVGAVSAALVLGFCGVVGIVAWMGKEKADQFATEMAASATTTTTLSAQDAALKKREAVETDRRLFLQEKRLDDGAREMIFRSALRRIGERCDKIQSALLTGRGVWTVDCSPGHTFAFRFNRDGALIDARRVR